MAIDYISLGKRIKEQRIKSGMTQSEMAEKVQISTAYISHIESGKAHASLKTLVDICNALHTGMDSLLVASLEAAFEIASQELHSIAKAFSKEEITQMIQTLEKLKNLK